MSQQDNKEMAKHFYRASAADFKKIPGSPVAYWVGDLLVNSFVDGVPLGEISEAKRGIATGNNERFIRYWFELDFGRVGLYLTREQAIESNLTWFPHNKGGDFRRWYGNNELVVNWKSNGEEIKNQPVKASGDRGWRNTNEELCFNNGITWGGLTSSELSFRWSDYGALFDTNKGPMMFPDRAGFLVLGFLNSRLASEYFKLLNPTISFQNADVNRLPFLVKEYGHLEQEVNALVGKAVEITKYDWSCFENHWEFQCSPLLEMEFSLASLNVKKFTENSFRLSTELQECENNISHLFCRVVGCYCERNVLSDVNLNINPCFKLELNTWNESCDDSLSSDLILDFISYAIGCMMGRYSLDREGLVYAHAGNVGFNDLVAEGAYKTFAADGDGILPLTSEHWFEDDIAARIEEFVRTVWGADTLEENLQFIADSLCLSAIKPPKKGGETSRETIRRYLSTQFFKDHLKTYKKRPIYWLFSSGKEKAFECLVYLHRYNEATLPRMRTEYVTPLLGQMASRIERLRLQQADASTAEAKRLDKQIDGLTKQLAELRAFDDQLKHHADMKITLDLDDGVKVNYGKFGTLLSDVKAITGDKGE